jgi:hypothetical protein
MSVLDCPIRFKDGSPGHLMRNRSIADSPFGERDQVSIKIFRTQDILGPATEYISHRPGEFIRQDIDPSASGVFSDAELADALENNPEGALEEFMAQAWIAVGKKSEDVAEGIDGHPITAEEARSVRALLAGASIERL